MKYLILIYMALALTGCASLSAGLSAAGNGLSKNNRVTCNTSYYGTTSTSYCQ